jgi:hypothetical protein
MIRFKNQVFDMKESFSVSRYPDLKIFFLKFHRCVALMVVILCMIMFHAFTTRSFPPGRYSLGAFLTQTPKSLLLLSGLILSTFRVGSKLKALTCILLLPSFGFAMLAELYCPTGTGTGMFLLILWSYWIVIREERLN